MRIGDLITKHLTYFSRNLPKKISLIDIGCGKGDYTILLKEKDHVLYGLDIRDQLKERHREIKFILGDATSIGFPEATFDAVISLDVIEHIKDDKQFLSEFFRVLKPEGQFLLGTPNRNRLANILKRLIGKPLRYPYQLGSDVHGDVIHLREYDENNLVKLINKFTRTFKILPVGIGVAGRVFWENPYLFKKYCSYYLIIGRK